MNTNKILSIIVCALLLLVGCDYNDKYFEGYDDNPITDVVNYQGEYTGDYPSEGYFTDRSALEAAVSSMLKDKFLYIDKGSTASISVLYGDVTTGYQAADVSYELTTDDYNSMGEENGQPGKYDNFDDKMDVDAYLTAFLKEKYSTLEDGKTVSISYKFYATGAGTATKASAFKKESTGWIPVELEVYTTDIKYTLETEDYDSMGTESGKPGRYDNFDANMNIDHYLTNFLRVKFPYATSGQTAEVTYLYFVDKATSEQSRIYKFDGTTWTAFNPYEDVVEVTTKLAEMEFDGTNWLLKRLMGGTYKFVMAHEHYVMLYDWVKENKSAYLDSRNTTDEYYFGVATGHNNINNNYTTWKTYYNIGGEYNGLSDEQMQEIMDARMVEAITVILLPSSISKPDPGLTYTVVYQIYGGRGKGNYKMSFVYNEEEQKYESVSGVTPE